MLTVGLDVHQRVSVLCILDHHGRHVRSKTIRGGWDQLRAELLKLSQRFQICYEASCGYGSRDQLLLQHRGVLLPRVHHWPVTQCVLPTFPAGIALSGA